MTVKEAAEALQAALKTVPGTRVYTDPSAMVDPPGLVIGPPRLQWQTMCTGPTEAVFTVYVVTALNDRTLERLWELVPQVADAVDNNMYDAVVLRADPGVFPAGGPDLPAYEMTIEISL